MRATILIIIAATSIASVTNAQRLQSQSPDTNKVVRVETARDHLTVIEMGDPVTMVAIGNQNAFTVERRENKVFVRPTDEEGRTNLFIWTSTGRFAYELVPAASVEQMHFAIDQPSTVAAALPEVQTQLTELSAFPPDMMTKADPILLYGERGSAGRVEIALRDVYERDDRLYLRYAIFNQSAQPYEPSRPAAWQVRVVKSPFSLIPLAGHQLSNRASRNLKIDSVEQLEILNAEQVSLVEPGAQGIGWVSIRSKTVKRANNRVLRLNFAADRDGLVEALLVLAPTNGRREVAHGRSEGK